MTVRVGIFGTSWWADTIYAPPITAHPDAELVAVCGRREAPAQAFADTWSVPQVYTDPEQMLREADLDAVVVATANDSHHDLSIAALNADVHVLCEKPLGLNVAEAERMAALAKDKGAITMVPFTYHYMPVNRWVRQLVADGYVGQPLHINARYYTSFGFDTSYSWRFDKGIAGSGIIGDIGSHWIHLARWLMGEAETSVSTLSSTFVERGPRPDGSDYEPLEDSAVMNVRYASGAYGVIQVSSVCWEGGNFSQNHQLEIHGTEGTIYAHCDWDTIQDVSGMKKGDNTRSPLPIPDDIWGDVRRDNVHDTYRDVFRTTNAMTRAWITAIEAGTQVEPSFAEGLAVQKVLDAAVESGETGGCPVAIT
jgi:predicted dehydrogenase